MPALTRANTASSRCAHIVSGFVYVSALIAALCLAASAQDQGTQSVLLSSGQSAKHPVHIVAKRTGTANQQPVNAAASAPTCYDSTGVNAGPCHFDYYGGPVISNPDVVVVYWKSTVSSVVNCGGGTDSKGCIGVSRFLGALSNSTFVDMLQQYNTLGIEATAGSQVGTASTDQTIGRGTLHTGSPFVITPSAANSGSTIGDTQIQDEIQLQTAAGHLPAPQTDSTGQNVNTLYFVYFPAGMTITDTGGAGTSCVDFCAYHSTFSGTFNAKTLEIPYGVIPDFGAGGGCDLGCGSGTQFQNVSSASSHEFAESITDTAVGIGTIVDYPLAWYDVNNGEIGDPCNQNTDTLKFDSITYTFQQEFSQKSYNNNHSAGCVSPGALTFTLAAPTSASTGTAFDVTLKVGNSDGSKYVGTVHFTSSDSAATLPSDYTFITADAGTHKFVGEVILHTGGSQTITAADAHQPSTAGKATVTVSSGTKTSTTTTLSSSTNPSTYNQQVTFTAVVTATSGSPTGLVTFKDGASILGTGTLSGGVASVLVSTLAVGTHSISANYGGDTNFSGSSSTLVSQIVNKATTSTALTSSPNPSLVNQQVTFTATVKGVNGGTPTGSVTFKQGTTALATGSLVSGVASFSTTYSTAGSRSLTATYSGDGNYLSSTSPAHAQTISKIPTTTTLSSSNNPSTFGGAVTFTATVSSSSGTPPNGEIVKFMDGTALLGTGSITSGVASFTTSALTAGTHKVKATYASDSAFSGSSSLVLSQVVKGLPTTSSVSSSGSPSIYGQTITFKATVLDPSSSGTPTGTVTFKSGAAILGTRTLSSGTATFSTTTLAVGIKSITVTYSGDTKYAASTSAAVPQTVTKATSATGIISSLNPATSGISVTFTISVTPQFTGTPSGSAKLTLGTTALATVTLVSGKASYTTTTLPKGSDVIKATYGGSGNFSGSSGLITQTVN
jgi:Bacterial Ig-like domain (group 3)